MICPFCKQEYSDSVCRIHIQKCAENPKNKKVADAKPKRIQKPTANKR